MNHLATILYALVLVLEAMFAPTLAIAQATDTQKFTHSLPLPARLGKMTIDAQSHFELSTTNGAKFDQEVKLHHALHSGYAYDPLRIAATASLLDLSTLHVGDNEVAHLTVDFKGIMLSGLPYFLEIQMADRLKANEIQLQRDPNDKSHGTLTRSVNVRVGAPQIKGLSDIRVRLDGIKVQIADLLRLPAADSRRAQIPHLRADQLKLNTQLLHKLSLQEVPCFPEITRTVSFPIWERGADSSNSGSDASGSASAKIGVSGDVVLKLQPVCGITVDSQNTLATYVIVRVTIQSHGYFGARAEAGGSVSVKFCSSCGDVQKWVQLPPSEVIDQQTLDVVHNLLRDSVPTSSDLIALEKPLLDAMRADSTISKLQDKIIEDLIGTPDNPKPVAELCKLFAMRPMAANSPEAMVCKYSEQLPKEPAWILIPPKPPLLCDKTLANNCHHVQTQAIPCLPPGCGRFPRPPCGPPGCPSTKVLAPEFPPGCTEMEQICNAWNKVTDATKRLADQKKKYEQDLLKAKDELQRSANAFAKYGSKKFTYETARVFARANLFVTNINEVVAKKLIDWSWDLSKEGLSFQRRVDVIEEMVQSDFKKLLAPIKADASARLAFRSTAHILEVAPGIESKVTVCGDDKVNAAPQVCGSVRFQTHRGTTKPLAGQLDVVDLVLDLNATITAGGATHKLHSSNTKFFNSPTIRLPGSDIQSVPDEKEFKLPIQ